MKFISSGALRAICSHLSTGLDIAEPIDKIERFRRWQNPETMVEYGNGDATYRAAGGRDGIRRLVDTFFDIMAADPRYRVIYDWHPPDGEVSRDKLALFLCGWMGGPRPFVDKYGPIRIPDAHRHLAITAVERDLWLGCMQEALARQDYPRDLAEYLLRQLAVPAERIRQACSGG